MVYYYSKSQLTFKRLILKWVKSLVLFEYMLVSEKKKKQKKKQKTPGTFKLMSQPAHSYVQTILDYYLIWSVAQFLYWQCFNNWEQVEDLVKEFFALMDKKGYQYVIKEWFERWLYPTYSPDLAPSNYYLFQSIAHFLCSWHFNN